MVPDKIDRYEIKREIGRGGMATVLLGYDPRFRRDVAIKLLPREFLHDPQFRARFQREAQTIASLEHPSIVPVYDFGDADGQLFLVMRLMSNGTLAERLEKGPLSIPETVSIFNRLAQALDSAHALGIIHRDLKPANILFDRWENAYLSDFGIAKLLADSNTALTAAGGLVGTPAYMSPEQVKARVKLDGRSDVYALGAILFEALTGQQPYKADTPIGLAFMHVTEPIPRIQDSNPKLPVNYQAIVDQAMAKNRDARPSTAVSLATMISDLAREGDTAVSPPPPAANESLDSATDPKIAEPKPIVVNPPQPTPNPPQPTPQKTEVLSPEHEVPVSTPRPDSQPKPSSSPARRGLPIWAWVVGGLVLLISIFGISSLFGNGAEDGVGTATAVPIIAAATSTESPTPPPTATDTPSPTPTNAPTETPTRKATETAVPQLIEPSPTATQCPAPQLRVTLASVNIRSGPGANYTGIGFAFSDDLLPIIAATSDNSWYIVEFEEEYGWVSADVIELLAEDDCNEISVAATIPAPPPPTATPIPPTNTPAPQPTQPPKSSDPGSNPQPQPSKTPVP